MSVSCDENSFREDIVALANECTSLIQEEAKNLFQHWVEEFPNSDLMARQELQTEATRQMTDSALQIFVESVIQSCPSGIQVAEKKKKDCISASPLKPCACARNCGKKVPRALREQIFEKYWAMSRRSRCKKFNKKIGLVVRHRGNGCGEWRKRTYFIYNDANEKIRICERMLLSTLGFYERTCLPPLDAVECQECTKVKSLKKCTVRITPLPL